MRRWTAIPLALTASSILLLGCGQDPDSTTTGDADSQVDTQTEGNREEEPCIGDEAAADDSASAQESGDDPAGSTETDQACTEGNDGGSTSGNVDSGGDPGTGTPSDGMGDDGGGSDTGTGMGTGG